MPFAPLYTDYEKEKYYLILEGPYRGKVGAAYRLLSCDNDNIAIQISCDSDYDPKVFAPHQLREIDYFLYEIMYIGETIKARQEARYRHMVIIETIIWALTAAVIGLGLVIIFMNYILPALK